jgi:hypothetical protein
MNWIHSSPLWTGDDLNLILCRLDEISSKSILTTFKIFLPLSIYYFSPIPKQIINNAKVTNLNLSSFSLM